MRLNSKVVYRGVLYELIEELNNGTVLIKNKDGSIVVQLHMVKEYIND